MARKPSVRIKNGYWFSEAGGGGRYLGRCDSVSHAEAMARLWSALAGGWDRVGVLDNEGDDGAIARPSANERTITSRCSAAPPARSSFVRSPAQAPSNTTPHNLSTTTQESTVTELMERFLTWLGRHRSDRTQEERRRHLHCFCHAYGDMKAVAITASHLERFQDDLAARHALDYVKKHITSVQAMFNRGSKLGWLPQDFRPFASVETIRLPAKPLLEAELPTVGEVQALLAHADADLTPVGCGRGSRRRKPEEYRSGEANPWRGFGDLLQCFHATGARTSQLLAARVADFQPITHQLVLGKHKRSKTLTEPTARRIALNAEVLGIVRRRCERRPTDAPIFTQPRNGRPWDRHSAAERFHAVRERAGVRSTITIYSFRHLWISEMRMANVDVLLVARMAGTSVAMIERVYGHFRNQSYQDAQARLDRERATRGL